jgi:hypothetical protein
LKPYADWFHLISLDRSGQLAAVAACSLSATPVPISSSFSVGSHSLPLLSQPFSPGFFKVSHSAAAAAHASATKINPAMRQIQSRLERSKLIIAPNHLNFDLSLI